MNGTKNPTDKHDSEPSRTEREVIISFKRIKCFNTLEITKSSLYYSNLMYKSIHKSPIQVQLMMPCKYDLYALT